MHKSPEFIPDWLVVMNDRSGVDGKQLAKLFGFKDGNSLSCSVYNGSFPPPDFMTGDMKPGFVAKKWKGKGMWLKSTVIAEIRRRKALEDAMANK
jgi:hypothetical protein